MKISLNVESGDPELFALDESEPVIKSSNCEACSSFCNSRQAGTSESCEVSSKLNTFYVALWAYSDYGGGNITFENVLSVTAYGNVLMFGTCFIAVKKRLYPLSNHLVMRIEI